MSDQGLYTTQHRGSAESAEPHAAGTEPRLSLIVYHRDGAEAFPLVEGSTVVVGRQLPDGRVLAEPSLSRRHAQFSLRSGQIVVEDLGSANGTWIGGERIDHRQVAPGEEITLGSAVACVHALSFGAAGHGLLGHGAFRHALTAELRRARFFRRALAVVMISPLESRSAHVASCASAVLERIRSIDLAALYSKDTLEVLLPEATSDEAFEIARAIVAAAGAKLRAGVASFPDPAASEEELIELARRAMQRADAEGPVSAARAGQAASELPYGAPEAEPDPTQPIAESPAFASVLSTAARLGRGIIPVLIVGETGSGKEVLARFIHERSPRRSEPLICVNCAAIPTQLVESTLFGHERGAFTGATQQQRGVFEAATGGSVLLDEIGELPPPAQAALLRVLETKRITRIGSTREITVDIRVLAATHRDLDAMCDAGLFRRDLLYRLNTMTLRVPPLRKRREDIALLARRFLAETNAVNGLSVQGIEPDALSLLENHDWPGNVRELRNALERAAVIAQGPTITVDDLPEDIQSPAETRAHVTGGAPQDEELPDFRTQLDLAEMDILRRALEQAGHNQTLAAKQLRMPLRTLVHKLRVHGIRRPSGR